MASEFMKVEAKYWDGKIAVAEVPDRWLDYFIENAKLDHANCCFPTDMEHRLCWVPESTIKSSAMAELSKLRGDYRI